MEKKYRRVSTLGLAQRFDFSQYPPGFHIWFRACIQGAKRRDLTFTLTLEQAYELSQAQCYYCERVGVNLVRGFKYVGMDRIENDKGYTFDNVVSCCKVCNAMKGKMTGQQFFEQVKRIANVL